MPVPAASFPVRPRVRLPMSGEPAPLDDEVLDLVRAGRRGLAAIVDPTGSGKSAALQSLAARLPPGSPVRLFEGAEVPTPADLRESLAIYATSSPRPGSHVAQWRMSPWGANEWIEYLLAMHRDACGSVMTRLCAAKSTANLKGIPALWRPALDEMASDPTLADPCLALIRVLEQSVPPGTFAPLQRIALAEVLHIEPNQVGVDPRDVAVLMRDAGPEDGPALPGGGPAPPEIDPALGPILQLLWFCSAGASEPRFPLSLLMNSTVLVLLARATVLEDLTACDKYPGYCWVSFPTALIDALSWVLPARPELLAALREVAEGSRSGPRSLAASLVHASGGSWVPLPKQAYYPGGRLRGMSWEGADLAGAFLPSADLVRARLRKADLTGARGLWALGGPGVRAVSGLRSGWLRS